MSFVEFHFKGKNGKTRKENEYKHKHAGSLVLTCEQNNDGTIIISSKLIPVCCPKGKKKKKKTDSYNITFNLGSNDKHYLDC